MRIFEISLCGKLNGVVHSEGPGKFWAPVDGSPVSEGLTGSDYALGGGVDYGVPKSFHLNTR